MSEPIEETYFNWLYAKVAQVAVPTPSTRFYTLMRDLHTTQFIWLVSGDDNRVEDGLEIRKEFLTQMQLDQDPSWLSIPCSVLEMLIAFSRRAAFDTEKSAREWFWIFLDNLGISGLSDATTNVTQIVYDVMDTFVYRTYEYNGHGGLFPLQESDQDQRKVELWYQFCDWLIENDIF